MLVTILHGLEGAPDVRALGDATDGNTEASFDDVSDGAYYAAAVAWASENTIISGYGNNRLCPWTT